MKRHGNTLQKRFDPFVDRRARDIRNLLTDALLAAATRRQIAPLEAAAQGLLSRHPDRIHQAFILDRLARYREVWPRLASDSPPGHFHRILALWQRQLFFEVHAFLEVDWLKASGTRRRALQALIQAAAVYVHREFGHSRAAARLAAKAAENLAVCGADLTEIANLDDLRESLADPAKPPPVLQAAAAANAKGPPD